MLIGLRHISPLCLSSLSHEKEDIWTYGHIKSLSIPIMYFQSHLVISVDDFEEFYIVAVIMDPSERHY